MVFQKYNYEEVDDGKSSKFNAGLLQMQRIHQLQDRVHNLNLNAKGWNIECDEWNFNLIVINLNSLLQEVAPKLSTTEREQGFEVKKKIEDLLQTNPPYPSPKNRNGNKKYLLDETNWRTIRQVLFVYEVMIRDFLDKHNLNSPTEDESALF